MSLDYIAIDFETANQYANSACSVGLVRFTDGEECDSVYSLIRPDKLYFIPEWTRDIHHISYDDVRNKPNFAEVWDNIVRPFIEQTPDLPLVAHNATFDMNVLRACCDYYGMDKPPLKYFDSLQLSRKMWRQWRCHKLTFLAEQFDIVYDAHQALDDARTCGKLVALAGQQKKCCDLKELLSKLGVKMKKV